MSGEYKVINGSFHEKAYKILHKMREERPVVAVCAAPHKASALEMSIKAAGFRCIFFTMRCRGYVAFA